MTNEINIMAVDTSTAVMAGATYNESKILATVQTEAERNHSIHIMTNIEKLIADSQWTVNQVSHYVVGIGPGSYTGIRIAVSAIKTLAWVTKKPVVTVSSLEGLAYSAIEEQLEQLQTSIAIVPIMDARRGQVYTALFNYDGKLGTWTRQHTDHITLMVSWVEQLKELLTQVDEVWIVGDVLLHAEAITELENAMNDRVKSKIQLMNGAALAKLGLAAIKQNNGVYEDELVHRVAPNYAQLTEAEVKQNAKEKEERTNG